jgi:hypothetical protein
MNTNIAYIPGHDVERSGILNRFLPPLPEDIASTWLKEHLPQGSWLIDPLGASPSLALEAARTGYRVLVIAKNPVIRFLLDLYADPPDEDDLQTALATLAASRKGDERLEPYIINHYLSECDQCGQTINVEAFIWERESTTPFARLYQCPHCKDFGEHYVTVGDTTRASKYASGGIYKARALERIISATNPDRAHVEEVINTYLPRSLHILITLINIYEGLSKTKTDFDHVPSPLQRLLAGMILHAFDKSNALWPYPTSRARPRKLAVPPRFRENNIWLALEEAISLIVSSEKPIPITYWPDMPPESGGLTVFSGSLKELKDLFNTSSSSRIKFDGVLTMYPRPNQAFWTLSTLWAGWLWGREIIHQYKHVFSRRRYDWLWHTNALYQVLKELPGLLQGKPPILGLVSEVEPGFITSALVASTSAGFDLQGLSLRTDQELAQLSLSPITQSEKYDDQNKAANPVNRCIESSSITYIQDRSEPVEYIQLFTVGLTTLIKPQLNSLQSHQLPVDKYAYIHETLEKEYSTNKAYKRYGGSDKSLNVGQWWLAEEFTENIRQNPLSDQVEKFIVQTLQQHSKFTLPALDKVVCDTFQGLNTPNFNLVKLCLDSYCDPDPMDKKIMRIRAQDLREVRQIEIMSMRNSLAIIGESMNFTTDDDTPLIWRGPNGDPEFVFYILSSATIGNIPYTNPFKSSQSVIILPGSRSQLITYKLKHNTRLRKEIETGWRFLKFRHLRRLEDAPLIDRDNLLEQLELDPLSESDPQMRLL